MSGLAGSNSVVLSEKVPSTVARVSSARSLGLRAQRPLLVGIRLERVDQGGVFLHRPSMSPVCSVISCVKVVRDLMRLGGGGL